MKSPANFRAATVTIDFSTTGRAWTPSGEESSRARSAAEVSELQTRGAPIPHPEHAFENLRSPDPTNNSVRCSSKYIVVILPGSSSLEELKQKRATPAAL